MANKSKSKQIKEVKPYREYEAALEKLVEHHKHIIEKKVREAQAKIDEQSLSKKNAVMEVGTFLAKTKQVKLSTISSEITRRFKGYINRGWVMQCVLAEWKESRTKSGNWKNRYTQSKASSGQNDAQETSFETESVTEEEERRKETAQAYDRLNEEDRSRIQHIDNLITDLTGLDLADRGRIGMETERGGNWRRNLVEKSDEYRFRIIKRQSKGGLLNYQGSIQTLYHVVNRFMEQLDHELEVSSQKEQFGQ